MSPPGCPKGEYRSAQREGTSVDHVAPRWRRVSLGGSLQARIELRPDGAMIVGSTEPLAPYPTRLTERLLHWAAVAPVRSLAA